MRLSKRLDRIAANVQLRGVVADIGCDHGFTSIYLVQQGKVSSAIAMDINQGPLARAAEHVVQYGMTDKIQLRLSDGMEKLMPGEADTIVISGLGGTLMTKILQQGSDVVKSAGELVLSPQSEIFLVRKKVHELGYEIVHEEMVKDQKKYYVILRAVPGKESYEEHEYFYGRKLVQEKDSVFQDFLEKEQKRLAEVEIHMSGKKLSSQGRKRLENCLSQQEKIRAILNKMKH